VSSIGGSTVLQHWNVPELQNKAKAALRLGQVDVLTLAPIWLPDEGIENFARLALAHNAEARITVQAFWLPNDRYEPVYPLETKKYPNLDHNATDLTVLARENSRYQTDLENFVQGLNQKLGKTAVLVVPVGSASVTLRQKIAAGQVPGLKQQRDLFTDPWGHPKPALKVLAAYCHFAVIYRHSPVGLPIPPGLTEAGYDDVALNRQLQEIAWNTVRQHASSGVPVKGPATRK